MYCILAILILTSPRHIQVLFTPCITLMHRHSIDNVCSANWIYGHIPIEYWIYEYFIYNQRKNWCQNTMQLPLPHSDLPRLLLADFREPRQTTPWVFWKSVKVKTLFVLWGSSLIRLAAMTAITAFLNLSIEWEELRTAGAADAPPKLSVPNVCNKTQTCFLNWSYLKKDGKDRLVLVHLSKKKQDGVRMHLMKQKLMRHFAHGFLMT